MFTKFELTFSTTFAFKTRPKSRWIFWYRWNRILRSFCGGRCGGFYDLNFLLKSWVNLFHACDNHWIKIIIFQNAPYTLIEQNIFVIWSGLTQGNFFRYSSVLSPWLVYFLSKFFSFENFEWNSAFSLKTTFKAAE